MSIKIVRNWQTKNNKFTIGQDAKGRLFAKCNECNRTTNIMKEFDFKKGVITSKAVCNACGTISRL